MSYWVHIPEPLELLGPLCGGTFPVRQVWAAWVARLFYHLLILLGFHLQEEATMIILALYTIHVQADACTTKLTILSVVDDQVGKSRLQRNPIIVFFVHTSTYYYLSRVVQQNNLIPVPMNTLTSHTVHTRIYIPVHIYSPPPPPLPPLQVYVFNKRNMVNYFYPLHCIGKECMLITKCMLNQKAFKW